MTTPIVVLGAGGHTASILWTIIRINAQAPTWNVLGVLDDGSPDPARLVRWGLPLLGPLAGLGTSDVGFYAAGGGFPATRRAMVAAVPVDRVAPAMVDPTAAIGSGTTLGAGTIVFQGTAVASAVTLGEQVSIAWGVAIGHRTTIGDYVSIMPGASVSGDCIIGSDVTVGTNATVLPGVRVGDAAVIGAGALVTRDVPAGATMVGVPARERAR